MKTSNENNAKELNGNVEDALCTILVLHIFFKCYETITEIYDKDAELRFFTSKNFVFYKLCPQH